MKNIFKIGVLYSLKITSAYAFLGITPSSGNIIEDGNQSNSSLNAIFSKAAGIGSPVIWLLMSGIIVITGLSLFYSNENILKTLGKLIAAFGFVGLLFGIIKLFASGG